MTRVLNWAACPHTTLSSPHCLTSSRCLCRSAEPQAPGLCISRFGTTSVPGAGQSLVKFLPASPLLVALYMTDLLCTAARSPSLVLFFSGAVYLFHTLASLPSPTSHPLVGITGRLLVEPKSPERIRSVPSWRLKLAASFLLGPARPTHCTSL